MNECLLRVRRLSGLMWRLALGGLLLAPMSGHAADCQRTVRWYDDAPYSSRATDGTVQGINPDLLREALRRMGCKAEFVEMPWARALFELEAGRLDILPGAFRTPERERFAHFSIPVNRSPNVLFVRKGHPGQAHIGKLADILDMPFRLGTQINVSYGPDYDSLLSNPTFTARLEKVPNRRAAWGMIDLDRLDGLIADEVTGLIELRQMGLDNKIARSKVIVADKPAAIALSKKSVQPAFVDELNRALEAMMADGSYKAILQRHLPCPVSVKRLGCQ